MAPSPSASRSVASNAARTPGSMPSPVSSSGTPSRIPSRRSAVGIRTGSGSPSDVASQWSLPTRCENSSAESATVRVSVPHWSSEEAKAIMP